MTKKITINSKNITIEADLGNAFLIFIDRPLQQYKLALVEENDPGNIRYFADKLIYTINQFDRLYGSQKRK